MASTNQDLFFGCVVCDCFEGHEKQEIKFAPYEPEEQGYPSTISPGSTLVSDYVSSLTSGSPSTRGAPDSSQTSEQPTVGVTFNYNVSNVDEVSDKSERSKGPSINPLPVKEMKDGEGILSWPNGRRYVGTFKNGKLHGKGVMTWPDGSCYDGEYQNDKKHGWGIFTWADGRKYTGEWKEGKRHGTGTYINAKKEIRAFTWENDVPIQGGRK